MALGTEEEQVDTTAVILVWKSPKTYGPYLRQQANKPLLGAGLRFLLIFFLSIIFLVVSLKTLLPPIDPVDKEHVKIPRSFDDLKALNTVLQIYKERNNYRVLGSFTIVYLFLQAFSLPGSMYLSILAGAMYGFKALFLVAFCVATGATLCYLLSASLGPALLLASSRWRNRLEAWKARIAAQNDNLVSYLIVLRVAPLPPHWVINIVAPHLGIRLPLFWISTFLGTLGVSYIHISIGGTLDEMTSSADFHLISLKNILGLGGIIAAVLIPVLVRYAWSSELADAAAENEIGAIALPPDVLGNENDFIVDTTGENKVVNKAKLIFLDQDGQEIDRTDVKLDVASPIDDQQDRKTGI